MNTKTDQKTIYEAFDGTRFDNKSKCEEYEAKKASAHVIAADVIPHAIMSRDWVDSSACDSELILVFFPKTFSDLLVIEAWAKDVDVKFDVSKVPLGEPIMFDIGDFARSKYYDDDSLKGIVEVYGYIGTVTEFKIGYCNAIDRMIEEANKYAAFRQAV